MKEWSLVVFCPAHNIERTARELVGRVTKEAAELRSKGVSLKLMLVVDDGSADLTPKILEASAGKRLFLRTVRKDKNRGPLAAVLDGMRLSLAAARKMRLKLSRTVFVRMDSDLEHQPEDIGKVIAPVMRGKAEICAGYLPFDSRSGADYAAFNRKVGLEDSRKFLGVKLPQFCPGFYAVRGDLFAALVPKAGSAAVTFGRKYGEEMVGVDFVLLAIAAALGKKVSVVKLRKIEGKWVKKTPGGKLRGYFSHRKKLVEFVK